MQLWKWAAGVAAAGLLAGCAPQAADKTATVYTGGDILTLAGETPTYVDRKSVV